MSFITDRQTIFDIGVFMQNEKTPELFRFYDRTETPGGQRKLFKILSMPVSDIVILENRKAQIRYFLQLDDFLKLDRRSFMFVEHYLTNRHLPLRNNFIDAFRDSMANKLKASNDYYIIREGIFHLTGILKQLKGFLDNLTKPVVPDSLEKLFDEAREYLGKTQLAQILLKRPKESRKLKARQTNAMDHFFRNEYKKPELLSVLDTIYKIDVLQSHCRLMRDEKFCLPEYADEIKPVFEAEDCYHPLLKEPVTNSFSIQGDRSLCFVTGPNMSGKSTFMKTVGLLTWLAHLGTPVPAKSLKMPILNGLFTTINLPDSLNLGYSHFYAEVSRIREMALAVRENGNMVVILDELFRGTNVKDASDGTLMVVQALSKIKGTFFFISTHILEVAEQLAGSGNIDFKCFESGLNETTPVYDYRLKPGISRERVGMQIIKNENIEEILDEIIRKQK